MRIHPSLSCLALLAFAACATDGAAPPPAAPRAAASAPSSFDGTWRGTGTLVSRGGTSCSEPTQTGTMRVAGGQAQLEFGSRTGERLSGPVRPDGSLSLQAGARMFRGQFTGDSFTGSYIDPRCPREWTMRRQA